MENKNHGVRIIRKDVFWEKFNGQEFTELGVARSHLHLADFSNTKIKGSMFYSSRINNCFFYDAVFENCQFVECTIEGNAFDNAQLNNVLFERCTLEWNSFLNSRWDKVSFDDTTRFYNNFTGIDITTALSGITFSSVVDSKGRKLIYDIERKHFFHPLFQGQIYEVVRFLRAVPDRFMPRQYKIELYGLVTYLDEKY